MALKLHLTRVAALIIAAGILAISPPDANSEAAIPQLTSLDAADRDARALRDDARTALAVVKSRRAVDQLPALRFYAYRVRAGENFWTIVSRSGLDLDTVLSVNGLASPRDLKQGRQIYLPNMRGIIARGGDAALIEARVREMGIDPVYVRRANRSDDLAKDYLFIPCGRLSTLERSLFIGTGFASPTGRGPLRRTSGFGKRSNPFKGHGTEFHSGVDIACPTGTRVYAAREGVVVHAGYHGGYGQVVIVRHEHGYQSVYGHLSDIRVRPGQRVTADTLLALSGNTGRTTGPHLHFEVRRGESAVNPGMLFRRGGNTHPRAEHS